jgi:hypothetical protein
MYCSAARAVMAAVRARRTAALKWASVVVGYPATLFTEDAVASDERQQNQHYERLY